MKKEIISSKQGVTLITMFLIGSALVINSGTEAGKDAWIAMLLGMIMVIPMLFVYSRLIKVYPGRDLYDLQKLLFGKVIGSITSIFFILFTLHLGAMILRNFSEFIQAVSFPETPQFFTLILMGTLCICGTKCGIEVLARWSSFVFPIIFIVVASLVIFSIPAAELTNIKPILYNGIKPVIQSSFSIFAYPFAEVTLFTMVFNSLNNKKNTFRIFLIGTLIAGIMLTVVAIRNIAVLGPETIDSYYFPAYNAVSVISIGNFFDRFEILVAIMFVVSGFLKATICLYTASKGFSKLFNVDCYSEFAAPLGIIMFTMASFVYENLMEMFQWAGTIYKYYSFPFLVLMPIIILIFAEVKSRRERGKGAQIKPQKT